MYNQLTRWARCYIFYVHLNLDWSLFKLERMCCSPGFVWILISALKQAEYSGITFCMDRYRRAEVWHPGALMVQVLYCDSLYCTHVQDLKLFVYRSIQTFHSLVNSVRAHWPRSFPYFAQDLEVTFRRMLTVGGFPIMPIGLGFPHIQMSRHM